MASHLEDMIAVASGTPAQVDTWSALLRAKSIRFIVSTSSPRPNQDASDPDPVELWVHRRDVERARTILQHATPSGGPSFW